MTVVYATPDDLAGEPWETSPDNATPLLYRASQMVARATRTDVYDTDVNGLPTDPVVVAAMRDATCIQAVVFAGLGGDPNLAGLDAPAAARGKSIGSASVQYDTSISASVAGFQARQQAYAGLCDSAVDALRDAGLCSARVWSYG